MPDDTPDTAHRRRPRGRRKRARRARRLARALMREFRRDPAWQARLLHAVLHGDPENSPGPDDRGPGLGAPASLSAPRW